MTPIAQRRSGVICTITGLVGAGSAVVLLAWPAQVAKGTVKYPFSTKGFLTAQTFFFVHHWGMAIGLVALAGCGAVGAARYARIGSWLAVLGVVLLSGSELLAMHYANHSFDAANKGLMGSAYGVSSTLIGLGLLLAGVGVARSGGWQGWHRWTPLAIAIAEFLVLTPGIMAGFVAARLVIGFWMLLFAALGVALTAEAGAAPVRPSEAAQNAPSSTPRSASGAARMPSH